MKFGTTHFLLYDILNPTVTDEVFDGISFGTI